MSSPPVPRPDEERQYKEILYLLMENVRATKASFYLVEENGNFRLMTQYGFTRADRYPAVIQRTDPLFIAVQEQREPRFYNDFQKAGKLKELMEGASSTRILTAPLYLDRRIVAILDVRDKAARAPFTTEDLVAVDDILKRFAQRLRGQARFAPINVDDASLLGGSGPLDSLASAAPIRFEAPGRHDSIAARMDPSSSRIETAYDESAPLRFQDAGFINPGLTPALSVREAELSIAHLPTGTERTKRLVADSLALGGGLKPPVVTGPLARETGFYRLYLEMCLQIPDVEIAAISSFQPEGAEVTIVSRRPIAEDVEPALMENLERVFARTGAHFSMPPVRAVHPHQLPGGSQTPVQKTEIAAIQSSVLTASPEWVAILSLVLGEAVGTDSREGLKNIHLLVKNSLAEIRSASLYREAYRGLVNKLLEPGLKKYSALKTHSFNVGRMARKFATFLNLSPVEVEQITVAAILHDVGARELNYDELYTKRNLTEEELGLLKEHARVGALIVDEVPWPYPVGPLIRHHHERWDGNGYPDGLRGEQIPYGARLLHLCEAYDAMTSASSYRAVLSSSQALDILVSKGGTQFDPELAVAFKTMLERAKPQREAH